MWIEQDKRSIVSLEEFDRGDYLHVFRETDRMRRLPRDSCHEICRGRSLATVFFEPSTRTRLSFESAVQLLGASCLTMGHPDMTKSSAGETLEDTVRVLDGYADALALRHPRDDAAAVADALCSHPVINAGCGTLEHPTQALLDIYTMNVAFGTVDGLSIGLMGDLRSQRTITSLLLALRCFNVTAHFICHPERSPRPELLKRIGSELRWSMTQSLSDVLSELDVLYAIRIPRDRTDGPAHYEALRGPRRVAARDLANAKPQLRILNPLPRHDEIAVNVDDSEHAYYFQQAHLGRFVRAALFSLAIRAVH